MKKDFKTLIDLKLTIDNGNFASDLSLNRLAADNFKRGDSIIENYSTLLTCVHSNGID